MSRRRAIDWINWTMYRRAWGLPVLAALVVLATSFRPQTPPPSLLPPTFSNEQAAQLLGKAKDFDHAYPDRRPGSPGSLESANWLRGEFERLGLKTTFVPNTTVAPGHAAPVSLANVEATLPGRTGETVVLYAHRDNDGPRGATGSPVSTLALLRTAEDLAATRDRRRTYLFVSTDGASLNGAGARSLAHRLRKLPGKVVAVVALDRIGSSAAPLSVPFAPSGHFSQPLGLTLAAQQAVRAEGGDANPPGLVSQVLRLGAPVTLFEQGQLVGEGRPVVTLTSGPERASSGPRGGAPDAPATGSAVRALQRLLGTLDAVDALQSAGKTYVMSANRVYRGWALKILVASMLVPFWVAAVDVMVRMRRRWNLAAAVGTVARAMLAGVWSLVSLWMLGAMGWLPATSDHPPTPDTLGHVPLVPVLLWLCLTTMGWLLARGPDWRHAGADGRNQCVLVVSLLAMGLLAALALSVNPYAVLFALPALHTWLWLASRHVYGQRHVPSVWAAGLLGPLVAGLVVGSSFDLGLHAPWYWLELVQTRTLPGSLSLLVACGAGAATLALVAALGRVSHPALPRVRALTRELPSSRAGVRELLAGPAVAGAPRARAALLRLASTARDSRAGGLARRTLPDGDSSRAARRRPAPTADGASTRRARPPRDDASRAAAQRHRRAVRSRSKTR